MEQRTLSLEENNARFDASGSLSLETSQDPALHITTPTSETDSVTISGAELSRCIAANQKREGRAIWSIPIFYSLMAVVLYVGNALLGDERLMRWLTSPLAYVPGIVFWLGMTAFLIGSIVNPRKRLREMAQDLAGRNDVRAVGPLIDALKLEDRKIRVIAKDALIELLPRLQPNDADLLTTEQRTLLCSKLSRTPQRFDSNLCTLSPVAFEREVSLRIAILQAFAQVGDSRALPIVQRLAQKEAKTAEQQRIQKAAQEGLPLLLLRCEQARSHKTLLRASAPSDTGAETLLRPLTGAPETRPDELLRPGPPNP